MIRLRRQLEAGGGEVVGEFVGDQQVAASTAPTIMIAPTIS